MTRIFISYSRADELFARQLATALSNLGADIWIDVEDIPAGMKWSSAIQQGLDTAEALIVIITPESMASRNVEDEWQYFLDNGKPVIPVFLRDAKIHFQLNRIQWVDFKNQPFDVALVDLHSEMRRNGIKLAQPAKPTQDLPPLTHGHARTPSPEPTPTPVTSTNRGLMVGGGLVLLVVIIVAIVMSMSLLGNDTTDTDGTQTQQAFLDAGDTATFEATFAIQETANAENTQIFEVTQAQMTSDAQQAINETATAQAIPTHTPTNTPSPTVPAINLGPVNNNDDWEPVERVIDGVTMVLVPSGDFSLGASEAHFQFNYNECLPSFGAGTCAALDDEIPATLVTISDAYWIDKYEVSGDMVTGNGSDLPHVGITVLDAQLYCETRGAMLPTEQEWEYAAKGPSNWRYPWGNSWDLSNPRANICDASCTSDWRETNYNDGYAEAAPVTEFESGASWVGALNMAGNVWEWTSDLYESGITNTLRGGAWTWIRSEATTTSRDDGIAQTTDFYGFRCVRPYQEGDLDR